MSKIKEKAVAELRVKLGQAADPAAVIEQLYQSGALDDVLCRRFVVKQEFVRRYGSTEHSARSIHEDLAYEFGLTRQGVSQIVGGK